MTPPHPAADGDDPLRVVPIVKGQRRFNVMAKPLGPVCNLHCAYCYYLGKERLLGLSGSQPMADNILEKFIRDYIADNDALEVEFEWQGGEPTLLGVDFFRKVLDLQKQNCPNGKRVLNSLQTNGILLDDAWCRFLRENHFLVGLSIDGPKHLHDAYRVTKGGQPTFDRVFAAAKRLKKHGVPFNTLTVVHRQNARRPLDVYRFLSREVGPRVMQFIPLVEPRTFETVAPRHWDENTLPMVGTPRARPGSPDSIVTDWSVDPDDFGAFLCKVFDEWYQRDLGRHFVNLFESWAAVWLGRPARFASSTTFAARACSWNATAVSTVATTSSIPSTAWEASWTGRWSRRSSPAARCGSAWPSRTRCRSIAGSASICLPAGASVRGTASCALRRASRG